MDSTNIKLNDQSINQSNLFNEQFNQSIENSNNLNNNPNIDINNVNKLNYIREELLQMLDRTLKDLDDFDITEDLIDDEVYGDSDYSNDSK